MTDASPLAAPGMVEVLVGLRDLFTANEGVRIEVARHLGLTVNEVLALAHLQTHGPMSQRQLAAGLGMSPSAVTVMLDRLEPRGLVDRHPHPEDRRRMLVGVRTPAEDPLGLYAVMAKPFLAMSVEDRREAARLLGVLTEQVQGAAEEVRRLEPVAPPRRRVT